MLVLERWLFMIKRCTVCSRTYDEALSFCLQDGAVLSAERDPEETLVSSRPQANSPPDLLVVFLKPAQYTVEVRNTDGSACAKCPENLFIGNFQAKLPAAYRIKDVPAGPFNVTLSEGQRKEQWTVAAIGDVEIPRNRRCEMTAKEQYVVDQKGNCTAVLLDIKYFHELLAALEEIESIRACDVAKASDDEAIPFCRAPEEIESSRTSGS